MVAGGGATVVVGAASEVVGAVEVVVPAVVDGATLDVVVESSVVTGALLDEAAVPDSRPPSPEHAAATAIVSTARAMRRTAG